VKEEEANIIVAVINIISTDPDFISLINRIDFFLQNMTDIRFQIEQGMVDIGFTLTRKIFDYEFVDDTIISRIDGILLNTYRRDAQMSLKQLEILQAVGCYRIVVESENYEWTLPGNYEIISVRYENSKRFLKYITCLANAIPIDFNMTDTYIFKGFAGKTLNSIVNIQEPNITIERIDDPSSSSYFGVREGSLTVVAVVTFCGYSTYYCNL
jgi:hypothetical protein